MDFARLQRTLQELSQSLAVPDIMLCSFSLEHYEAITATQRKEDVFSFAEQWQDVCEMYACAERVNAAHVVALPEGYEFCALRFGASPLD